MTENKRFYNQFNRSYWEERYAHRHTGWDIGDIARPIKDYIDQIKDMSIEVLVPGSGSAYEAIYAWESGFESVDILDIARQPLIEIKRKFPAFPEDRIIHGDFFEHDKQYDLIIEQAFFCALDPLLRRKYVQKMHSLLKQRGKLVGLLWDAPLNKDEPPFGGDAGEYLNLFSDLFEIRVMESAKNSIKPRMNKELFIIFVKK